MLKHEEIGPGRGVRPTVHGVVFAICVWPALGGAMRRAKSAAAEPRRRAARAAVPKPYHHGDLRRVLIDAALQLVGEGGPDAVSVREASRRAGVSPGAAVRDFPSR